MAGQNLYGRVARLTISTPNTTTGDYTGTTRNVLEIDAGTDSANPGNIGQRIKFDIAKTDKKEPNTSKIVVINLNDSSRAQMQTKPVKLMLEVGYRDTGFTRIFVGDARSVDQVRNDADWETTAKLGDGERGYQNSRVAESFSPGTPQGQVLRYLANASGLQTGNAIDIATSMTTPFDQGYIVHGFWQQSFDRFVRSLGYTWSIQNETIQILQPGQALGLQIPLISESTGLVGSPEMGTPEKPTKPHLVKFTTLLVATQPGAKVHLTSDRYDADVYVKKCRFEGDTQGGPWFTHIEGIILKS